MTSVWSSASRVPSPAQPPDEVRPGRELVSKPESRRDLVEAAAPAQVRGDLQSIDPGMSITAIDTVSVDQLVEERRRNGDRVIGQAILAMLRD